MTGTQRGVDYAWPAAKRSASRHSDGTETVCCKQHGLLDFFPGHDLSVNSSVADLQGLAKCSCCMPGHNLLTDQAVEKLSGSQASYINLSFRGSRSQRKLDVPPKARETSPKIARRDVVLNPPNIDSRERLRRLRCRMPVGIYKALYVTRSCSAQNAIQTPFSDDRRRSAHLPSSSPEAL